METYRLLQCDFNHKYNFALTLEEPYAILNYRYWLVFAMGKNYWEGMFCLYKSYHLPLNALEIINLELEGKTYSNYVVAAYDTIPNLTMGFASELHVNKWNNHPLFGERNQSEKWFWMMVKQLFNELKERKKRVMAFGV